MLKFKNVSKIYEVGNQEIKAVDDISFEVEKGKLTVILGPSGSGKSTILNLIGGIDRATKGEIIFEGDNIVNYNDQKLSGYRQKIVGFIFQFYNLIPNLNALENVQIAAQLTGNKKNSEEKLKEVGLLGRKNNFPNQMSGGEMQRVAIARALSKNPQLLLCDEPTGALDTETGAKIMKLLKNVSTNSDTAVVLVTHNDEFVKLADKVIRLCDGKIV